MPKIYTAELPVRTYDLDALGHVNNVVYLNYLEEAATQASASNGYDWDYYMDNRVIWVVNKWTIRYMGQAVYGDVMEIDTWVSDFKRVQSHREYVMRRQRDGELIARARTNWVFMNMDNMRPQRIPADFEEAFGVDRNEAQEDIGVRIRNPQIIENAHRYRWQKPVEFHEVDVAHHVNNAIYLRWIESAYINALRASGWSLERQRDEAGFTILAAGHEIDYIKSAKMGMTIRVESRVVEASRVRGAWIHEVYDDETSDLLVRCYSVGAFLDLSDETPKPTRIPENIMQAILSGGAG